MSQLDTTPTLIVLVLIGVAGVVMSLWRIAQGGGQRLFGIASLALMGGVLVLVISVGLMFQRVSDAVNTSGPGNFGPGGPGFQYTPIPWSTAPGFATPIGPVLNIGH